jgi:tetratricopeptide (TPR) repeat protein
LLILLTSCSFQNGDREMKEAITLFENELYDSAQVKIKNAIALGTIVYPQEQCYTILGNTFHELEEYDSAIHYHKKSIAANPEYTSGWTNLGIAYRLTENYDEAEKCYKKALSLEPDDPYCHSSLGALYIFKNKPDRAIKHLEKSVELMPDLATTHANLAVAYAMTSDTIKSENEFKRALALGYKNGDQLLERIEEFKNK